MSTTLSLKVALEYSGVKQGKVASVLAIDLSTIDMGAILTLFSQYPGEEEMCVYALCSQYSVCVCVYVCAFRKRLDDYVRAVPASARARVSLCQSCVGVDSGPVFVCVCVCLRISQLYVPI